ncbi:hypothetical protein VIN01S_25750 [Vibrio inusitatus NBRC 102082]|uniref:Uncharacterized protein n=1 Tax=Vibrio inusitatus NBRC 102082 TaxID=1219070 RepID=A0A4Y3HXS1_9VIBR|nr:DUF4344 domain-containing metallopeptidase [Vibrio inusitatus]GEA51771.1 hypothetical protein VIN01S_25750 [Vibrio inusitatus NBRC 102082]
MFRNGILCVLLVSPLCWSQSLVDLEYQQRKSKDDQQAYQLILDSGVNEKFISLVNQLFPFEQPISLVYGPDSSGPYYDPEQHSIYIPYSFVLESQYYFSKNRPKNEVNQGVTDTLMHTLLHEVGHALVADNLIPILGKEEDAVDNLATIVMINYLENGQDAALNAADMFDYESESGGEYYDFSEYAGVHSFNLQRYFATLCLVYGSDPKRNKGLLDEIEEDYLADQQDTCEETYHQLYENWHRYLNNS